MKSFKDLKKQLNENGASTSFIVPGANRPSASDVGGKHNLLAIENPRIVDRLNAAIAHVTRNPSMDPEAVMIDVRDNVLAHAALSFDYVSDIAEGEHRFPLKQYGGRKGMTPEDGFIDDDGIEHKVGHGMDLHVMVTKEENYLYRVSAAIIPSEMQDEEELDIEEV